MSYFQNSFNYSLCVPQKIGGRGVKYFSHYFRHHSREVKIKCQNIIFIHIRTLFFLNFFNGVYFSQVLVSKFTELLTTCTTMSSGRGVKKNSHLPDHHHRQEDPFIPIWSQKN